MPYTIHIARRFGEDRARFEKLDDALRSTARHTGGALAGSAFTTMAGFGILITSRLTPFQQMGQVTVYAVGLSLVAAILVLPSMPGPMGEVGPPPGRVGGRLELSGVGSRSGAT